MAGERAADSPAALMAALADAVNGDAALVRRGRYLNVEFVIEVDAERYYVTVAAGRIAAVTPGPALMRPWHFAIAASADAWQRFWQPMPEPGYHDIFAMTKSGAARIDGDLQPLMANLRYIKEVLAIPRRLGASADDGRGTVGRGG